MISSLPTLTERPKAWCGRAVDPGGLKQALLAEQHAGSLRTADALAAAIGHGVCAAREVNVGLQGQHLGRRIHHQRDVAAPRRLGDHARAERTLVARTGQDVAHGGTLVEGRFQLGLVLHDDQFHAQHADGVIVDIVRVGRNDDFALQAGEVGQLLHALRIAAGDGGGGEVGEAAQQPAVMIPHSAPLISARRLLTPSINSSIWTKLRDA